MEQLEGRVAVITGGGSGIGEGFARVCHDAGMRVVVSDVEEEQAARVANSIRELGGEAIGLRADVSDAASVQELADRAYEEFGEVNLLCSNAGVMMVAPLLESPIEDWQWTLGVNLYGAIHCTNAFVPRMREQDGEAHVVFTASIAGTRPIHETPIGVYVASKYAVTGLRGDAAHGTRARRHRRLDPLPRRRGHADLHRHAQPPGRTGRPRLTSARGRGAHG